MPEYVEYHFRRLYHGVSAGADTEDLLTTNVPTNRLWRIEHVLMRDHSGAPDNLQVLIGGRGEEYLICEDSGPASDTPYWYNVAFVIGEGDWLIGRFVGAATGHNLEFGFMGVEIRKVG